MSSSPKKIFVFSGQGSQYYQMGQVFYEKNTDFRNAMLDMDAIVKDLAGFSVVDALYHENRNKAEVFDQLAVSHPAIFMIEFALARSLMNANVIPDLTLGTSLGTYAAAAIAGCLSLEDALKVVVRQVKIFEEHSAQGAMIAILADQSLFSEEILRENGHIASYNFPTHFVVSLAQDKVDVVEQFLKQKQITFQRLPVRYPFHSPWIADARSPMLELLQSIDLKPASIPVVCCAQNGIFNHLPSDFFWRIAHEPIHFQQTIANLERDGTYQYIDVGPAGTLATFLKYGLPKTSTSKAFTIMTPFGRELDNFAAVASLAN